MVIVEASLSARAFGRALETKLLQDLGLGAAIVLAVYLVLKVADLIARGATSYLAVPGFHSTLYWIETLFGVVVPLLILATPRGRRNPRTLLAAGALIVFGVVMNRLDTALLGWWAYAGSGPFYIPSIGELTITLSLVAIEVVGFGLAAKFLPVFSQEEGHAEREGVQALA